MREVNASSALSPTSIEVRTVEPGTPFEIDIRLDPQSISDVVTLDKTSLRFAWLDTSKTKSTRR